MLFLWFTIARTFLRLVVPAQSIVFPGASNTLWDNLCQQGQISLPGSEVSVPSCFNFFACVLCFIFPTSLQFPGAFLFVLFFQLSPSSQASTYFLSSPNFCFPGVAVPGPGEAAFGAGFYSTIFCFLECAGKATELQL